MHKGPICACAAMILLTMAAPALAFDSTKLVLPPDASIADRNAALSKGFWQEWKTTQQSETYKSLSQAQDCGCELPAKEQAAGSAKEQAAGSANKQVAGAPNPKAVLDIVVTRQDDAARILSESAKLDGDAAKSAALATVVRMRIPRSVQKAAVEKVEPAARPQVEHFRATLSAGIPGLPGIYLGDTPDSSVDLTERGSGPAGFEPVSGGAWGCPTRY